MAKITACSLFLGGYYVTHAEYDENATLPDGWVAMSPPGAVPDEKLAYTVDGQTWQFCDDHGQLKPANVPTTVRIEKEMFFRLLTPIERMKLASFEHDDTLPLTAKAQIRALLMHLNMIQNVNRFDPLFIGALHFLESIGILGNGRAGVLLTP